MTDDENGVLKYNHREHHETIEKKVEALESSIKTNKINASKRMDKLGKVDGSLQKHIAELGTKLQKDRENSLIEYDQFLDNVKHTEKLETKIKIFWCYFKNIIKEYNLDKLMFTGWTCTSCHRPIFYGENNVVDETLCALCNDQIYIKNELEKRIEKLENDAEYKIIVEGTEVAYKLKNRREDKPDPISCDLDDETNDCYFGIEGGKWHGIEEGYTRYTPKEEPEQHSSKSLLPPTFNEATEAMDRLKLEKEVKESNAKFKKLQTKDKDGVEKQKLKKLDKDLENIFGNPKETKDDKIKQTLVRIRDDFQQICNDKVHYDDITIWRNYAGKHDQMIEELLDEIFIAKGEQRDEYEDCPRCRGYGEIKYKPRNDPAETTEIRGCTYCKGEGRIKKPKKLTLIDFLTEYIKIYENKNNRSSTDYLVAWIGLASKFHRIIKISLETIKEEQSDEQPPPKPDCFSRLISQEDPRYCGHRIECIKEGQKLPSRLKEFIKRFWGIVNRDKYLVTSDEELGKAIKLLYLDYKNIIDEFRVEAHK